MKMRMIAGMAFVAVGVVAAFGVMRVAPIAEARSAVEPYAEATVQNCSAQMPAPYDQWVDSERRLMVTAAFPMVEEVFLSSGETCTTEVTIRSCTTKTEQVNCRDIGTPIIVRVCETKVTETCTDTTTTITVPCD